MLEIRIDLLTKETWDIFPTYVRKRYNCLDWLEN